jgi:hypothetical protein
LRLARIDRRPVSQAAEAFGFSRPTFYQARAAYSSLRPQVPLGEENSPDAPGAKESASWDFTHPDRAPEQELNRVIWKSIKGRDSEPPAAILNVQSEAEFKSESSN